MPDASNGRGPASADEFDRELRELTAGTAGEPLFFEPSAAERAKSAVVRVRPKPPARRRGRLVIAVIAVVILLAAAVLGWLRYMRVPGSARPPTAAGSGVTPSVTPGLMGTIAPLNLFDQPPADPFARTRADRWADGAAGIVTPAAKPAGRFSAAQVAAAYLTTRKLLIAANLDNQTLLGGAPTAFARLLTVKQRATFLADLGKTRSWVASFAPGSAELIGDVIKVRGTMSARAVTGSGGGVVLAIRVDYLFAYAVELPGDPNDWTRVVVHDHGSVDFARWDHPRGALGALGPWDRVVVGSADVQCGTGDGYLHPDYPSDQVIDFRQSAPFINPFSPATRATAIGAACGR